MPRTDVKINSLLAATDVDVLPDSAIIEDHGDHVVVRTPTNPTYHWGNFILVRGAPTFGDRERWERVYEQAFGLVRESRHCAIAWDVPSPAVAAHAEWRAAGYDVDVSVALVAQPGELIEHARASRDVVIRSLDPLADSVRWMEVLNLQIATRDPLHEEVAYRTFAASRLADRRVRFRAGDGAWFVACVRDGSVVASCGVIVTDGRARYQAVDTAVEFRRRGIATRLVHDAGQIAINRFGASQLVIGADAAYHALPLYQSLGFVERERCTGVCWWPGGSVASRHPRWYVDAADDAG